MPSFAKLLSRHDHLRSAAEYLGHPNSHYGRMISSDLRSEAWPGGSRGQRIERPSGLAE